MVFPQKWSAVNSCNLHGIQYRIAKRGLELLEVGGKMVYSTCSLNPLEDEAVLARILSETGDSVRILDSSSLVPGLKFKPGLEEWKVSDRNGVLYGSFGEVPKEFHSLIRPYMFSPEDKEERAKLNLNR